MNVLIQFWLTTFQNLSGLFSFLLMSTGLLLITLPFTRWSFTEKKNFHPNSDENLVGSFSICYKFFIFVANGQNWIVRIPENLPTKTIAENVFYYLIEFTEKSNWIFESLRAQVQRETIHYTQFSAQLIPPPTSLLFSVPSGYPSNAKGLNMLWRYIFDQMSCNEMLQSSLFEPSGFPKINIAQCPGRGKTNLLS